MKKRIPGNDLRKHIYILIYATQLQNVEPHILHFKAELYHSGSRLQTKPGIRLK